MRHIFLTLFFLSTLLFIGCEKSTKDMVEVKVEANQIRNTKIPYEIVVIDGCQYIESFRDIEYRDFTVYSLTHKGSCTNIIHRFQ